MRFIINRFFLFFIVSSWLLWGNTSSLHAHTPAATLSATIKADVKSVCKKGTQPIITFTGANGTTPYTFSYTINGVSQPDIITTSESSVTISVPTNEAGVFSYALTKVTDATHTSQVISDQSIDVTVNETPTITGSTQICGIGQTIELIGSGTPATSLAWQSSATNIATITSDGLATSVAIGTSTITYTDNNTCTTTVNIAVNNNPTVDIVVPSGAQCAGAPIPFKSTVSEGGTESYTYSYLWDFNDSQTGTDRYEQNPSHFYNFTGGGTATQIFNIKLSVTNDKTGCSTTTPIQLLTLVQSPDATITSDAYTYTSNGTTVFRICSSSSSTFKFYNGSQTSATNNASYTIDWGDGTTPFSETAWDKDTPLTHTYAVGLWSLKYTIKSLQGCDITKTYNVFVGSNPSVGLSNPGNTSICKGDQVTFPINGTDHNPIGTTYQLSFGDGSDTTFVHPAPSTISHTYTQSSCGNTTPDGIANSFYVRIMANNPCAPSYSSTTVQVSTPPIAGISLSEKNGCINKAFPIYSAIAEGEEVNGDECSNSPKVVWKITPSTGVTISSVFLGDDHGSDNVNTWTTGARSISPIFTQPGQYTVSLRTGNRCNTSTKDMTFCIEPALSIPTFTVDKTEGCMPLTVNASSTTSTSQLCSAPSYLWRVGYTPGFGGSSSAFECSNPTAENPSFTFTSPGTYSLTLTIYSACGGVISKITKVIVKQAPRVTINSIEDICNTNSISPTINLVEGTPNTENLVYKWTYSDRAASSSPDPGTLTYNTPGTYSISLSVDNECGTSDTDTQQFTVKPVPQITNPVSDLSQTICSDWSTTPLTLTSDLDGTTYSWSAPTNSGVTGYATSGNGDLIPAQTIRNANDHSVSINYSITPYLDGCYGSVVHDIITVNPNPQIDTQPLSGATCIEGTPLPLSVSVSNYAGTPSYKWYKNTTASNSGGVAIPDATTSSYLPSASVAGIYYFYCKISFEGGCDLTSDVATISIYNPLEVVNQPTEEQTICIGGQPTLSVTSTGGDGNPTYQWYSNTTASTTDGQAITGETNASYIPSSTTTGTTYYYCKLETTGKDCHSATSNAAKVTVVNDPIVDIQPESSQTLCQNSTPINLTVKATGGIGETYHYQWYNMTNGSSISDATDATYTPPTTKASTTAYFCRITQDGIGCDAMSNTATVSVNPGPSFTEQPQSTSYCLNDPATALSVHYTNGAGTPTYEWYTTTNLHITGTKIEGANTSTYLPSTTTVGDNYYYCKIKLSISDCGELTSQPALITIKPRPVITTSKTALICSETSFAITPSDALPDQVPAGTNYIWTNPTIVPSGSISGASAQSTPQSSISQKLTNTTESPSIVTYTVTPIADGCSGTNFNVIVTVNPPIKVVETTKHATCYGVNNGAIECTISGGVPFTSGDPQNISWTGPDNFTATTANISNLGPGYYTLTISDAGKCPFTWTYSVAQPNDIVISTDSKKDVTCNGYNNGSIAISIAGGTPPYSYSWTKDGNTYASTQNLTSLSPGTYEVTVSDANLCGPKTMSFTITEPATLTTSVAQQTNILCYGAATGAITLNTTGGTPIETSSGTFDYKYSWTGPNGYTSTSSDISNLKAGNYALTVSDQNGCSASLAATLTQNSDIVITTGTSPITCYGANNATIDLSISGGTAPYQTQWSNMATGTSLNNLSAGSYTVTVIDANNCTKSSSITITDPPVFSIDPVVKNVTCYGKNDGSITLNTKGDIISVVWSDGSTAGSERNNIGPGSYTVNISNGSPCIIHKTFIITEPQSLAVDGQVTDALDCTNANSGSIVLTTSGGTMPYSYIWSNSATTKDIEKVQAGSYYVTVTDANKCTLTNQYKISRPDPMSLSLSSTYTYDCSAQHLYQTFTTNTTGGLPPYTFVWSSGTPSSSGTSMKTDQSGLISVTVNDSRGCTISSSATSSIPELGMTYKLLDCNTRTYQFDPLTINEATENYSYVWNFGDGTTATSKSAQHSFSTAGIHTIQLRLTGYSCTTTYSKSIVVEPIPTLSISPEAKFCKGDSIIVYANGANTYTWNNGTTSDHLLLKQDGDYSVKGVTSAGCYNTLAFKASYYPTYEYPILSDKNDISFQNPTVRLWSDDEPALYYLWDFGDNTTAEGLNQTHTYNIQKGGYYDVTLKATNLYGCKSLVHKFILITNDTNLNTFTPNGDGYNDVFLKGWHVKIYNRNGVLITDSTDGWDGTYHGKTVSPDTYFYIVYYMTESGTKTKEGYVTLVR